MKNDQQIKKTNTKYNPIQRRFSSKVSILKSLIENHLIPSKKKN